MDAAKKVRMLMASEDITGSKLAEMAGMTQSNLSKKLKSNSFSVSDMNKIAEGVGAEFEGFFVLKDGNKI